MNARIYVLIFFGWAVLVIVTPMLILLSGSSQPEDSDGLLAEVVKLRRSPILLRSKSVVTLTHARRDDFIAYGEDIGFWDFITAMTSFPTKTDGQLLDPWEGQGV